MIIQLDALLACYLQTGYLTTAIDLRALSRPTMKLPETLPEPIGEYEIELPSSVVRELWNRPHDKRFHLGVLGLSARLSTPRAAAQYRTLRILSDNGVDTSKLRAATTYAAIQGVRRMLFSKPQYGRAWAIKQRTR